MKAVGALNAWFSLLGLFFGEAFKVLRNTQPPVLDTAGPPGLFEAKYSAFPIFTNPVCVRLPACRH